MTVGSSALVFLAMGAVLSLSWLEALPERKGDKGSPRWHTTGDLRWKATFFRVCGPIFFTIGLIEAAIWIVTE